MDHLNDRVLQRTLTKAAGSFIVGRNLESLRAVAMGASDVPAEAGWFRKLRHSRVGLSIAALVVILTGLSTLTDTTDKLLILMKLKPDSFQLAKDDERARFSRELARAIWLRLFLTREYLKAIKRNYPETHKDQIWARYSLAVHDWNRELMVNILSLDQHYGSRKRGQFEGTIQDFFRRINWCLEAIRFNEAGIRCHDNMSEDIPRLENYIDLLNSHVYCFVTGLPDPSDKCFEESFSAQKD